MPKKVPLKKRKKVMSKEMTKKVVIEKEDTKERRTMEEMAIATNQEKEKKSKLNQTLKTTASSPSLVEQNFRWEIIYLVDSKRLIFLHIALYW